MLEKEILKSYSLDIDFLDYDKRKDLTQSIVYSEADRNTAFINATLKMGGEAINLNGYKVVVGIRNNESESFLNLCNITSVEEGRVSIPFSADSLSSLGTNKFEVVLYKGDKKIVSPAFHYRAVESLTDENSVEGSTDFGVLQVLITQVQEALDKVGEATTRVENLERTVGENENIRIANENTRIENETNRVNSEQNRETQEANRQRVFGEKVEEINQLNVAMTTKIEQVDGKIVEVGELITNTNKTIEEKLVQVDKDVKTTIDTKFDEKVEQVDIYIDNTLNQKTSDKFIEVDANLALYLAETNKKVSENLAENTKNVNVKLAEADASIANVGTKIQEITDAITANTERVDSKIAEVNVVKTQVVNDVNAKIVEVDTAKDTMSNTITNKIQEFEDRFGELESSNPTGEVLQARTSVDGTKHNNLSLRLSHEYNLKADKETTYTKDEVDELVSNATSIDDANISGTKVWSSNKVNAELGKKETPQGAQEKATKALNDAKTYTDGKVKDLISQSPETLDTLKELADALGNDPNFATTVTAQIGQKANKEDVYTKSEVDKIVGASTSIDDENTSGLTTWSSNKINTSLGTKVDKVNGKGLSTNDFTNEQKTKLESLQNYVHPNDANTRHVTDAEKANWNSKANGVHTHSDYALTTHRHSYNGLDDLPDIYNKTEVNNLVANATSIDDEATVNNKTWSSEKIHTEVEKVKESIKVNAGFDILITSQMWTQTPEGYTYEVNHGLNTSKFSISAYDNVTKEGMLVGYKYIDNNRVLVRLTEPTEILLTLVNGDNQVQLNTESYSRVNVAHDQTVTPDMWTSENGEASIIIRHGLRTKKIFLSVFDSETFESVKFTCQPLDDTRVKVTIASPVGALINVINGEKEYVHLTKESEIDDTITTVSSTWSSKRMSDEIESLKATIAKLNVMLKSLSS